MSSSPGSVTWGVGGNYNVTVDVTNACGTSMASTPIVARCAGGQRFGVDGNRRVLWVVNGTHGLQGQARTRGRSIQI